MCLIFLCLCVYCMLYLASFCICVCFFVCVSYVVTSVKPIHQQLMMEKVSDIWRSTMFMRVLMCLMCSCLICKIWLVYVCDFFVCVSYLLPSGTPTHQQPKVSGLFAFMYMRVLICLTCAGDRKWKRFIVSVLVCAFFK